MLEGHSYRLLSTGLRTYKTARKYPVVKSDISAEFLPLYNPANRKIRLIFG